MSTDPTFVNGFDRIGSVVRSRRFKRAAISVSSFAAMFVVFHFGSDAAYAKTTTTTVPPKTTVDSAVLYTIKTGDTLSGIAAKNKVSVAGLATLNAIQNNDKIVAGKQIFLPVNSKSVPQKPQAEAKVTPKSVKLPDFGYPSTPTPGGPLPQKLLASPDRLKLKPHFVKAANDYKVPLDLLQAMTWNESGWQNNVKSSAKAIGIGQLIPDTVTFVNENLLTKPLDPKKADQNIVMSAAFLRYLLNETNNDPRLALGAYYQGLNSIRTKGLYGETVQYIRTVLALQYRYF